MTIGQGYLEKDLQVAARDATIVFLAALGGKIINNFDAGAIIYKRLTVLFPFPFLPLCLIPLLIERC